MSLGLIPLDLLQRGEWAEVVSLEGDADWVSRVSELGLRRGALVRMFQPGCPCLVQLGGSRLSLRLDDKVQVLVQPLAAHHEVA